MANTELDDLFFAAGIRVPGTPQLANNGKTGLPAPPATTDSPFTFDPEKGLFAGTGSTVNPAIAGAFKPGLISEPKTDMAALDVAITQADAILQQQAEADKLARQEVEDKLRGGAAGDDGVGSALDTSAGAGRSAAVGLYDPSSGIAPQTPEEAQLMASEPNPVQGAYIDQDGQWQARTGSLSPEDITRIMQWEANRATADDIIKRDRDKRALDADRAADETNKIAERQFTNEQSEALRLREVQEAENLKQLELQIAQIENETQKAIALERLQLEKDLSGTRIKEEKARVAGAIKQFQAETTEKIRQEKARVVGQQALEEAVAIRKGQIESAQMQAEQDFAFQQNALDRAIEAGQLEETIRSNQALEGIQQQQTALALQSFQFSILTSIAKSPEILFFAKDTPLFQMLTANLSPDINQMISEATPNENQGLLNLQQLARAGPKAQAEALFRQRALGGLSAEQAIGQFRQQSPAAPQTAGPRLQTAGSF